MIDPETYLTIQKALVWATLPAAVGFPIWYHLRMRWFESEMGRHVMGYSVVVALLYVTSIYGLYFPNHPGQQIVGISLAILMGVVVWWRVLVFVHIYRRTRRERARRKREGEDPPQVSGDF